jgi:hypothetical protein
MTSAWRGLALRSLFETPERNAPEAIYNGLGNQVFSVQDVRDGLPRLRRLAYADEARGRCALTEWCRGALRAYRWATGSRPVAQPLHELLGRLSVADNHG